MRLSRKHMWGKEIMLYVNMEANNMNYLWATPGLEMFISLLVFYFLYLNNQYVVWYDGIGQ